MNQKIVDPTTQPTLLFVDDEPHILKSLTRIFKPLSYQILTASSGEEGLKIMTEENVQVVISDMRMPEMNGAAFLEQVAARWPHSVRLLLTGYADLGSAVDAVNKGGIYAYLSKPWNDDELKLTVSRAAEQQALQTVVRHQNKELKQLNEQLEDKVKSRTKKLRKTMTFLKEAHGSLKKQFSTSIKVFANLLEIRESVSSESSKGHLRCVAERAKKLSIQMGLSEAEAQNVFFAALLHDIGKIALPDVLLGQPYQTMTIGDRSKYEKHPVIGQGALIAVNELQGAANLIRSHHEMYNGSGYPDKLKGNDIPLGARILTVLDDYDALQKGTLSQHRYTSEEAIDYLLKHQRRRYDPAVVVAFCELLNAEKKSKMDIKKMSCISSEELKSGMELAQDLVTSGGVMLLSKAHIIDKKMIEKLCDFEVETDCKLIFHI